MNSSSSMLLPSSGERDSAAPITLAPRPLTRLPSEMPVMVEDVAQGARM